MPFPLSTLYSIDECLVAARSGHLLFLLPSSSDAPSLEEKASSPCHEKRDECQPLVVVKEVPKEAKEAMKEEVKEAREEKKEEVKVAKKEEPTITNKNTAATTEHTAETSIPTHPTETTSAFFVRESDKGREVEGSGSSAAARLVYSQHLVVAAQLALRAVLVAHTRVPRVPEEAAAAQHRGGEHGGVPAVESHAGAGAVQRGGHREVRPAGAAAEAGERGGGAGDQRHAAAEAESADTHLRDRRRGARADGSRPTGLLRVQNWGEGGHPATRAKEGVCAGSE